MPIDLSWDALPPESTTPIVDKVDFRFGAKFQPRHHLLCAPTKARNISWMIG